MVGLYLMANTAPSKISHTNRSWNMAPRNEDKIIEPYTTTRKKGFNCLLPIMIKKAPINLKLAKRVNTNPNSEPKQGAIKLDTNPNPTKI